MGSNNSTHCSDGHRSLRTKRSILHSINRQVRLGRRRYNNMKNDASNMSNRALYVEYEDSGEVFCQYQGNQVGQFAHYSENAISFSSNEPIQRSSYSVNEQGGYQNEVNSFHGYNEDEAFHERPRSVSSEFDIVNNARPLYKCHSLNYELERSFYNPLYSAPYNSFQQRCHSLNDIRNVNQFNESFPSNASNGAQSSSLFRLRNSSCENFSSRPKSANSASTSVSSGRFKRNSLDDENSNGYTYDGDCYNFVDSQNFDGRRVKRKHENKFANVYQPNAIHAGSDIEINYAEQSWINQNETDDYNDHTNDNVDFFRQPDISFDVLDILSFPSVWSSYDVNRTGYSDIPLSSSEGKSIAKFFGRSSKSREFRLRIMGITRVENPFLHSLYVLKKEELAARNGHVDELFLYHGTKSEHVSKICEDNLNWRLFSEKHKFGQGVSFSPIATYSSHYSDDTFVRVMFLCKVLVSNVTLGSPEMTVPQNVDGVIYDTSIKEDTHVIVKYCDNEFYPLYKITYTKCAYT